MEKNSQPLTIMHVTVSFGGIQLNSLQEELFSLTLTTLEKQRKWMIQQQIMRDSSPPGSQWAAPWCLLGNHHKNVLFLSEQRWSRRMYWQRRLKPESWEIPRLEEQTKVSSSKVKEKKLGREARKKSKKRFQRNQKGKIDRRNNKKHHHHCLFYILPSIASFSFLLLPCKELWPF